MKELVGVQGPDTAVMAALSEQAVEAWNLQHQINVANLGRTSVNSLQAESRERRTNLDLFLRLVSALPVPQKDGFQFADKHANVESEESFAAFTSTLLHQPDYTYPQYSYVLGQRLGPKERGWVRSYPTLDLLLYTPSIPDRPFSSEYRSPPQARRDHFSVARAYGHDFLATQQSMNQRFRLTPERLEEAHDHKGKLVLDAKSCETVSIAGRFIRNNEKLSKPLLFLGDPAKPQDLEKHYQKMQKAQAEYEEKQRKAGQSVSHLALHMIGIDNAPFENGITTSTVMEFGVIPRVVDIAARFGQAALTKVNNVLSGKPESSYYLE